MGTGTWRNMSAAALQSVFDVLWELRLSNYAAGKAFKDWPVRRADLSRIVGAVSILGYDILLTFAREVRYLLSSSQQHAQVLISSRYNSFGSTSLFPMAYMQHSITWAYSAKSSFPKFLYIFTRYYGFGHIVWVRECYAKRSSLMCMTFQAVVWLVSEASDLEIAYI